MAAQVSTVFQNVSDAMNVTSSPVTVSPASESTARMTYKIMLTLLFSVVTVFGIVLNSLIIYIVYRWPEMKTPCNLFIMNIAVGDLCVATIAAPMRIIEVFVGWPFGDVLCRLVAPMQELFVTVSVVSHTTIALERFRAIVKPLKQKMSPRIAKFTIVAIWPVCYLMSSVPLAAITTVQTLRGVKRCSVAWPFELYRPIYQIYLVIIFIGVPLIIQTMAYFKIMKTLQMRLVPARSTSPNGSFVIVRDSSALNQRYLKRKRLIKTLAILVFAFQVCYIPRGVMMLVFEFGPTGVSTTKVYWYADLITLVLFYLKHVLNPIILFATSSEFRRWPFLQTLCL